MRRTQEKSGQEGYSTLFSGGGVLHGLRRRYQRGAGRALGWHRAGSQAAASPRGCITQFGAMPRSGANQREPQFCRQQLTLVTRLTSCAAAARAAPPTLAVRRLACGRTPPGLRAARASTCAARQGAGGQACGVRFGRGGCGGWWCASCPARRSAACTRLASHKGIHQRTSSQAANGPIARSICPSIHLSIQPTDPCTSRTRPPRHRPPSTCTTSSCAANAARPGPASCISWQRDSCDCGGQRGGTGGGGCDRGCWRRRKGGRETWGHNCAARVQHVSSTCVAAWPCLIATLEKHVWEGALPLSSRP